MTTEKQETMDWKEKIREDYSFLGKPIIDSTIAYWQEILDTELQSAVQKARIEIIQEIFTTWYKVAEHTNDTDDIWSTINTLQAKYLSPTQEKSKEPK